jgi:hypothetical protein
MANFVYTGEKQRAAKGDRDWDTADIRALLVMTNTTADTEQDASVIGDFTTLDEYDGTGYARVDLGVTTVTQDDANNRSEVDVADFTFGSSVGPGTRQAQAMVLYVDLGGSDTANPVVAYVDTGGFPFTGNGGAVNVTVNAEGLIQYT